MSIVKNQKIIEPEKSKDLKCLLIIKRLCLLFVALYILVKIAMTVYYWYRVDNSVPEDTSINTMFAVALIILNFFDVCMGTLYHYLREHFISFEPKCTHKS